MRSSKFGLAESPLRVVAPNPELGFNVEKNNQRLARLVLDSKKSTLLETTLLGNELYKNKNKFVLVDPHRVKVLYYLKYTEAYYNLIGSVIAQEVLHWRDRGVFESRNLTSHVFFDFLLPMYKIVMTDYKHTEHGERFWLRLIDEAFDRNLYIYYVNFLPMSPTVKNSIISITDKHDFAVLLSSVDDNTAPWGNTNKFMARRLLISDHEIS